MRIRNYLFVPACLVSFAVSALAHGSVDVSFVNPDRFADAGEYGARRDTNLKTIETFMRRLGHDRLAPGVALHIEVLDVDLAGSTRPSSKAGVLRIVRSGADRPSIKLRYRLEADGKAVTRGEESLSDLAFLYHPATYSTSDPLRYEKRLIEGWFNARFAAGMAIGIGIGANHR